MMKTKKKCAVHTCHHSIPGIKEGDRVSFFRLPPRKDRAKLWLDAIGRNSGGPSLLICERHFAKNSISAKRRLMWNAVPTLNLPQLRPAPRHPVTQTRTHGGAEPGTSSTPDGPDAPIKRERLEEDEASTATSGSLAELNIKRERLMEDEPSTATSGSLAELNIKRERLMEDEVSTATSGSLAELTKLLELSKAHLDPELASYIETKVLLQAQGLGEEFDENLSFFALKLYHSFPKTYKLMQKPLGLPLMAHIRRLFWPLRGEASPSWTRLLRARFSGAAPAARACVVCVARAPLRPALAYDARRDRLVGLAAGRRPASQAAVLLARGLHQPWRQPVACRLLPDCFDAGELRLWIKHVVSQLFLVIGLKVRALVTDFDDGFVPTGPTVTAEKPCFMVDGEKVYCFYDYTQMTITLRDHFMKYYNMNIEDLTATWEDIKELHEYNRNSEHPLPTGLTDEHLSPMEEASAGRRGRLASEALGRPLADALGAAVGLGALGGAARGTARLVSTVADLGDIMRKELGGGVDAYVGDVKSLRDIIWRLNRTTLASKQTGQALPDSGLLAALRAGAYAALALAERARVDGTTWPMRVLNNDPLHELFDRLRAQTGRETPTSEQMLAAFERSFAVNAMKSFASREDGRFSEFLNRASEMRDVWPAGPAAAGAALPAAQWAELLRAMRGRRRARLLARQLLARCLELHADCAPHAAYCSSEGLPPGLLRYTTLMTRKFHTHFAELVGGAAGLVQSLLSLMEGHCFEAPCPCFPTRYLNIMFFRYKIHTLLKCNNTRIAKDPNAEISLLMEDVDLSDDDDDEEK